MIAPSSLTLLAEVIATKNATFTDKWVMEHVTMGSKDKLLSVDRVRLRPH